MKWIFLVVSIISGTAGDLLSARGMAMHGELQDFSAGGIGHIFRYIVTQRYVITGVLSNAICFLTFLGLLSVAPVSFAVPVTALSYVFKVLLARWFLNECVTWRRWAGAVLVSIGVAMTFF